MYIYQFSAQTELTHNIPFSYGKP